MALTPKNAHQLAGELRALADETRLQMLELLADHPELCVCDLEHALGISQSKASRHLRYLHNARLLDDRREGVWIYYRLADDLEPPLRDILAKAREALDPEAASTLHERLEHWLAVKTCSAGGSCVPNSRSRVLS